MPGDHYHAVLAALRERYGELPDAEWVDLLGRWGIAVSELRDASKSIEPVQDAGLDSASRHISESGF